MVAKRQLHREQGLPVEGEESEGTPLATAGEGLGPVSASSPRSVSTSSPNGLQTSVETVLRFVSPERQQVTSLALGDKEAGGALASGEIDAERFPLSTIQGSPVAMGVGSPVGVQEGSGGEEGLPLSTEDYRGTSCKVPMYPLSLRRESDTEGCAPLSAEMGTEGEGSPLSIVGEGAPPSARRASSPSLTASLELLPEVPKEEPTPREEPWGR